MNRERVSGDDFMKKKSIKVHIVAPAELSQRMPVHFLLFREEKENYATFRLMTKECEIRKKIKIKGVITRHN